MFNLELVPSPEREMAVFNLDFRSPQGERTMLNLKFQSSPWGEGMFNLEFQPSPWGEGGRRRPGEGLRLVNPELRSPSSNCRVISDG